MHTECLTLWLRRDRYTACPVCRIPYSESEATASVSASGSNSIDEDVIANDDYEHIEEVDDIDEGESEEDLDDDEVVQIVSGLPSSTGSPDWSNRMMAEITLSI